MTATYLQHLLLLNFITSFTCSPENLSKFQTDNVFPFKIDYSHLSVLSFQKYKELILQKKILLYQC